MVAPIIAAGLKYALGQGLESAGLPSGLANPKGYLTGQITQGVDKALGVTPGLTGAIVNPKGAAAGVIKDIAKDALTGGKRENAIEDTSNYRDMDTNDYGGSFKRGGKIKSKPMSKPKASTASRRGDGIVQRGKTRGRMV
jgi:PPE-repeat protein